MDFKSDEAPFSSYGVVIGEPPAGITINLVCLCRAGRELNHAQAALVHVLPRGRTDGRPESEHNNWRPGGRAPIVDDGWVCFTLRRSCRRANIVLVQTTIVSCAAENNQMGLYIWPNALGRERFSQDNHPPPICANVAWQFGMKFFPTRTGIFAFYTRWNDSITMFSKHINVLSMRCKQVLIFYKLQVGEI